MKKEVQIALFAALTLAVSIWGYKFISGKNLFSGNYTYYAYYDNVQDVNTATPVQVNGYEVGTVISISPKPEDIKQIRLEFTVKRNINLPKYTVAELMPESPLGGKVIELRFDRMCEGDNCAPNKSVLEGRTLGILGALVKPDELDSTLASVSTAIDSTLGRLGEPDSDQAIDVSVRNLAVTLENFASISEQLDNLMKGSSRHLQVTMANMAEITDGLVKSNSRVDSMLSDLGQLTRDLREVRLSETIDLANGTLNQTESSLKVAQETMSEARLSIEELNGLLGRIAAGEGSMGKLMHDDQLYNNIESSTRNLDLLIQDIRLNPRRYFRLFGKKSREYEYPENDPAEKEKTGQGQ